MWARITQRARYSQGGHAALLDALREEFVAIQADRWTRRRARLDQMRQRLSTMRLFDPACRCGNFLVIACRELRALELEILREQQGTNGPSSSTRPRASRPSMRTSSMASRSRNGRRVAEIALRLMDHQTNMRIHEAFDQPFLQLPLPPDPRLHAGRTLRSASDAAFPAARSPGNSTAPSTAAIASSHA